MAQAMTGSALRRLPSADWLAFGVGMGAMFLHFAWPPALALVAVAVFAPSVLREVGLLHDADEFTVGVMRRAGFHAALAAAAVIFLDHGLAFLRIYPEGGGLSDATVLGAETLRKTIVWVFVISYLLQYWGARDGSVRVMLGMAVMMLAPLVSLVRPGSVASVPGWVAATVGSAVLLSLLALVVRRWPRAGGAMLLGACVAQVMFMSWAARGFAEARWGMIASMLQVILIFGVTGLALLHETAKREGE
jgi:hypothetical protein